MSTDPSVKEDAAVFPMRTVVKDTGVSPHKLRFWEGRYQLLQPERTESGHRLYSKAEVARIKIINDYVVKQGMSLIAVVELLGEAKQKK
jgi:MerR family transcriptional regulator, light-induced transcriptional regulator